MTLIPNDTIAEIRAKADIVAVIGRHVDLKKAGRNHKGLCPFHHEKSPSFNVNSEKGFFYCFGCQQKGDVFSFMMEYEGKSFVEAAESLAGQFGVAIPQTGISKEAYREARSEKKRLLDVTEIAARFFRDRLTRDPKGLGQAYLNDRGIGSEVASSFRLGFAPNDWRELVDALESKDESLSSAARAGLVVKQPKRDGYYDRFRNRLMCPVMNASGDVVGFSGRILQAEDNAAKYVNSPESPLYKKSKLLFGMPQARDGMKKFGAALLVEGNFDVLTLHQAGFTHTVAPLGTALTEDQANQLRRLCGKVIVLYDGDSAGRAATLKCLKILVAADCATEIALLPMGEDPDTLIKSGGKEALDKVLGHAQPAIEYFIHDVWSKSDASAHSRTESIAEAAGVLRTISDPTKRDLAVGTLAQALGIKENQLRIGLRRALQAAPSHTPIPQSSQPPRPTFAPPNRLELDICVVLFEHPQLLAIADELNVFSNLTNPQLRDMYSAAKRGESMLSIPSHKTIAEALMAGSPGEIKNPEEHLKALMHSKDMLEQREKLDDLQRQAEAAARMGDHETQRTLVRQILEQRKKVN